MPHVEPSCGQVMLTKRIYCSAVVEVVAATAATDLLPQTST